MDWTEPELTEVEAQKLMELLRSLDKEMAAQMDKQGMENYPAQYKTLVRGNYKQYLVERYDVERL